MATLHRKCRRCGARWSILERHNGRVGMERDDNLPLCPCGADEDEAERMIEVGLGVGLGGGASTGRCYPYFDRALGVQVDSAAHRKQLMAERGLVALDGDIDIDADARRQDDWNEKVKRRWDALQERYETDSEFADYRRLRDKGYYQDRARREREEATRGR